MIKSVELEGLFCIIKFAGKPPDRIRDELKGDGFKYYFPLAEWHGKPKYFSKYYAMHRYEQMRKKRRAQKPRLPPTLCGECYHADKGNISKCPWAREFKPVDGWDATRTMILSRATTRGGQPRKVEQESYCVKTCPLFRRG